MQRTNVVELKPTKRQAKLLKEMLVLAGGSCAKLVRKLANKAQEIGATFAKKDERSTTKTCPVCGEKNKPADRSYECFFCGYRQDRDVVGAINIWGRYVSTGSRLRPALTEVMV